MKILWFTWKDMTHPLAGGAEVVNEELAKRLVKDGHEVTLLVGGYKGCKQEDVINGYKVIRLGNRVSVYIKAWLYYRKNLKGISDLVIDEVNTVPFFAKFYVKERNILFVHQLCREIWFYELPKYIAWIGYLVEPLYLRLLSNRHAITISSSTKKDLMKCGFKSSNVFIISEGIEFEPIRDLSKITKYKNHTVLSIGSLRPMKRTIDQIKAFEIAKQTIPQLKLVVAGDHNHPYGQKIIDYISTSPYKDDIEVVGRVSKSKKIELMQRCHLVLQTAIKEGWGLTITEANAQGTPAIVYDSDGLRDSVKHNKTGIVCQINDPHSLANEISAILLDDKKYNRLRQSAWEWSMTITFEQSYVDFKNVITHEESL